jgi:oligopeptide/dipeptide ABC transporter ATP-binding protein
MNKTLLSVENLKTHIFTSRGVVKAVDGISFSLDEQETLGIVGESGCGKTITGLSILRLEPKPGARIVEGKILFKGEDLVKKTENEMRKIRGGEISIIMQDPNTTLNPVYTIGNQIGEAVKLHRKLKGKELINHIINSLRQLRIADADSRVNSYPHQLSGGMRQRVVGAMALSCYPSLIIADEPTTALDVTTQAQYLDLLSEVQEQTKVSLIFITHDLGIVASMCHKVCVMYMGKIVESGNVNDIWNKPRHPYTIALIESIPELEKKVERLTSIIGKVPSHFDLPNGCTFHPRCQKTIDKCKEEYPPIIDIGDGHSISCWQEK